MRCWDYKIRTFLWLLFKQKVGVQLNFARAYILAAEFYEYFKIYSPATWKFFIRSSRYVAVHGFVEGRYAYILVTTLNICFYKRQIKYCMLPWENCTGIKWLINDFGKVIKNREVTVLRGHENTVHTTVDYTLLYGMMEKFFLRL